MHRTPAKEPCKLRVHLYHDTNACTRYSLDGKLKHKKKLDEAYKSFRNNIVDSSIKYINTSSNYPNLIEFNDDYDTMPLTSDIYTLDAEEEDYILQEFPVLQASSAPEKKP